MIEKTRALYQGEIYRSYFYIGFGLFLLSSGIILLKYSHKIGWFYLALALILFSVYAFGKSIYINYLYQKRLKMYIQSHELNNVDVKNEYHFNLNRIQRKINNRRKYLYILIIGLVLMIGGIIAGEKGLAIGTITPILLVAATEFCETLLTEFRLWEYHRQLEKVMR